jgi:hypothetical protein
MYQERKKHTGAVYEACTGAGSGCETGAAGAGSGVAVVSFGASASSAFGAHRDFCIVTILGVICWPGYTAEYVMSRKMCEGEMMFARAMSLSRYAVSGKVY